jgi:hypothetical protein
MLAAPGCTYNAPEMVALETRRRDRMIRRLFALFENLNPSLRLDSAATSPIIIANIS